MATMKQTQSATRKVSSSWSGIMTVMLSVFIVACSSTMPVKPRYHDPSLPDNAAIFGYSPVSYFESNMAEKGSAEFTETYRNKQYYFTSAAQQSTFRSNPKMFVPRYDEYCPYSLALGRKVAIDPTNFLVHNDELLLFHDSVELNEVTLETLNAKLDEADRNSHLILIDMKF